MTPEAPARSWRCPPSAFKSALEEFRRFGGTVQGSDSFGDLGMSTPAGRLEGRYTFDGEEFTVTLTRKPEMIPIDMIWSRIDRLCGPPVMKA